MRVLLFMVLTARRKWASSLRHGAKRRGSNPERRIGLLCAVPALAMTNDGFDQE
ncbi:MAG: hypothetical protein ACREEL_10660 [Stellaceae bacterium]